ncbi:MAG: aspartate aminotransferase family protein [Bifidobacteriaceae bacterium]|jgi:4-aminobutyrate aminotransferase-like enzyme|nr:aspartate aminotransferase family protein [Bifidobacteriaceae bacterium]
MKPKKGRIGTMTQQIHPGNVRSAVSPLDTNAFGADPAVGLSARAADLLDRRRTALGPGYRAFYQRPIEVVRGEGAYLWSGDGERYLDMYNNVASVGHANPRVIAAVAEQWSLINTHTRYLHEGILKYAEDLLATFPDGLDHAVFTCTGSEANDLAIRLAREATRRRGVIVTRYAYHGGTIAVDACSPSTGEQFSVDSSWVRTIDAPATPSDGADPGPAMAQQIREKIGELESSGIGFAAFLLDSSFSSDGLVTAPAGFLAPVIDAVHQAGGLFIADEVQPGFGRLGDSLWGHTRHGVTADLVTLGKPMGNGFPVAATLFRPELVADTGVAYFNTFGGNPVAMAAAQAVLDEIRDRRLVDNSHQQGLALQAGLKGLATGCPWIAEVRGAGLFAAVEFADPVTGESAPEAASAIVNGLKDRGVLVSTVGPRGDALKIRPPLVVGEPEVSLFLETLETALAEELPI